MKILTMRISGRERVAIFFLCILAVVLSYYYFVDRPVRKALEIAKAESDSLTVELTGVEEKLTRMRRMRDEMEDITVGGTVSPMPSYNNKKDEITLLNDILSVTNDYSISFANVTRDGDQIRRNVALQFNVSSYDDMEDVLTKLSQSPYRCRIGDIRCSASSNGDLLAGGLSVSATATFFETMVGGTADSGLPETSAAAS